MISARRRLSLLSLAAAAGASLAVAAGAPSATGTTTQHSTRSAHLSVGVEVLRFSTRGRRLTATGIVTARVTDDRGHVRTTHSRVAMVAAAGGGCRVLHLYLDQLSLSLLGLNAHLDKVVLDITGQPHGGVLGALFCRLAKAKLASARAADARALTASLSRHNRVMAFQASISPVAQARSATSTCPVLDLVVGPLNLQLLGLVVDLNKVHLTVTATRGGGALGDLFCRLADNSTTTTTGTTTT